MSIDNANKIAPLPGIYRGIVEDTNDPEQLGRVKVRIEIVHPTPRTGVANSGIGTAELPWANVCEFSGLNYGDVNIPYRLGDCVMVMFEYGDCRYPVVFGGWKGNAKQPLYTDSKNQTTFDAYDADGNANTPKTNANVPLVDSFNQPITDATGAQVRGDMPVTASHADTPTEAQAQDYYTDSRARVATIIVSGKISLEIILPDVNGSYKDSTGTVYALNDTKNPVDATGNELPRPTLQYPYRRVISTPRGNRIEFSDVVGDEEIKITDIKGNFITMDTAEDLLKIDWKGNKIEHIHGDSIVQVDGTSYSYNRGGCGESVSIFSNQGFTHPCLKTGNPYSGNANGQLYSAVAASGSQHIRALNNTTVDTTAAAALVNVPAFTARYQVAKRITRTELDRMPLAKPKFPHLVAALPDNEPGIPVASNYRFVPDT